MADKETVTEVVFTAIDELNEQLPDEERLDKSSSTVLFGRGSNLDSLGLVNLIVGIEQGLADHFGREMTLADEKAMSQRSSPFRTVSTLVDYIVLRLEEAEDV